jgi:cobalt-zinc-cadmium efflux system protein
LSAHNHAVSGAESKLKWGVIISSLVLVMEVAGGFMANSLALLSDAGHVFADVIALALSWYGVRQAGRPAGSSMTFGYHRIGVIIAIVNAMSILAIAGLILYEAYQRLQERPEINSMLMLAIAVAGLAANIFIAAWLRKEQKDSLNVRSAFWHALGDALASVGVIAGAIIIMLTGLSWVDAVASILISLIIVAAAWGIFKEGTAILLEAVPAGIRVNDVAAGIRMVEGVRDVHDIHIWSISSGLHAMSCHVVLDDCPVSRAQEIQRKIGEILRGTFGISHCNIQMECEECGSTGLYCKLEPGESACGHNH